MIPYPECLRTQPLARLAAVDGPPARLDLSDGSADLRGVDAADQRVLAEVVQRLLRRTGRSWAIGGYGEVRRRILRPFPQMSATDRCVHLGVDIALPEGTVLHAVLPGTVLLAEHEDGAGNYGGLLVCRHAWPGMHPFLSLWGHLAPASLPPPGTALRAGDPVGAIGDLTERGGWFPHTHVQVITEAAAGDGWIRKGYATPADMPGMPHRCPDPTPLLAAGLAGADGPS